MKAGICAVFDIDDTLYLERDYVRTGFQAAGEQSGIEGFAELCWQAFERGERGTIFDRVLRALCVEPAPDLISTLVEAYRTHRPIIRLMADADRALRAIAGWASIAVISDGPFAAQALKVDSLGLARFADPIVLTGRWGAEFRKPHPRAFEQVQAICPARRYAYFGDNPRKDFSAPRSLGWTTVRIRRPGGLHFAVEDAQAADYEMEDCAGVPALLARW